MTSVGVKMIHSLYEDGGEGSPSNPVKFKNQDYKQIKESLLKEQKKFCDETFPASLDSLGELEDFNAEKLQQVKWVRPLDLNSDAVFVEDGTSRFDFQQGNVGNCWFLASIGALAQYKTLIGQVVPMDQSFKADYAGIFHFKFWRYGKWTDVVVDDQIPTIDDAPLSVTSTSKKEFWALLLEKAYAKICGSYGDMIAGNPPEAFKDFTGGVHMNYDLSKPPSDLWNVMNRAVQYKALMGCGTFGEMKGKEVQDKYNLTGGHMYCLTGLKELEVQGENVNLVRVWNPWGEGEWNGAWSDTSNEWTLVSEDVKNQCMKERDDGEFWMKMEDFCACYASMDICCITPNFVDGDVSRQWYCSVKEGRWEAGKSAGGSEFYEEEFWTNPQYRVTVKAVEGDNAGGRNVLLSLIQRPEEEHRKKMTHHLMGFYIFKVPPEAPKGRLPLSVLEGQEPIQTSKFTEMRELIEFYSMDPGEYLVVPFTLDANKTASIIFTVYSKAEVEIE